VIVSTTVYVVVTIGVTVGFDRVDVKPEGTDVQLYVLPPTAAAPMVVLDPRHIDVGLPAAATGNGFNVTDTAVRVPLTQLLVVFLASA
jgi:hypothetical protein